MPISIAGQLAVIQMISGLIYVFTWDGRMPPPVELVGIALLIGGVLLAIQRIRTTPEARRVTADGDTTAADAAPTVDEPARRVGGIGTLGRGWKRMSRVAFTTFAILKKPYGNPEVQEFDDLTPPTFEQAENSPGFIARAKEAPEQSQITNFERDWGRWGKFEVPRFYTGGRTDDTDSRASTLSLWQDLESVFAFVYDGLHRSTLSRRHEWFLKPEWPTYAAWWVVDDEIPTWSDACGRLEHLHDHGPTAFSFTLRQPFDADGAPTQLRRPAERPATRS